MVDNKSFNLVIVKPRRLTTLFTRLKVLVNSKIFNFLNRAGSVLIYAQGDNVRHNTNPKRKSVMQLSLN